MQLHETFLCSTAPLASSSSGLGALSVYDIQNGSCLASFKQSSARAHSVDHVNTTGGSGGLMFASQADKAVLNVYNFQKDQVAMKIVLPEKLSCIAVDRRGEFFAGGTAQGRIYLWEVASGIMFNAWDAHYRNVAVLRFTDDGAALLSGSEDSGVSVWSIPRLLDNNHQNELPSPYCMLSDHTLPITDIQCGVGGFPRCRVFTSSLDHTVKIWDLATRSLLTTFHFPSPIAHLVVDPTERLFFASSGEQVSDGVIYQANLFAPRANKAGLDGEIEMGAVGGQGAGDVIRIEIDGSADSGVGTGMNGSGPTRKRAVHVGAPITALALSLTSALLIVGTARGQVLVYDVPSHQLLRTIGVAPTSTGAAAGAHVAVTHVRAMLKPMDLVGHVGLSLASGAGVGGTSAGGREEIVVKCVAPFQRVRDAKARERHEVAIVLPAVRPQKHAFDDDYDEEEILEDHACFVPSPFGPVRSGGKADTGGDQARVEELEQEVERLKEQLSRAKGVNDAMWETVVKKVVKNVV